MENKSKLKKLQLPGTSRSKPNHICNSQISKFFSNVSQEDRENEFKTHVSSSTENIILVISDSNSGDEKNLSSDKEDSLLSSDKAISTEKIQEKTQIINKNTIPVDSTRSFKRQLQLCNGNNSNINESTNYRPKISKFFEETLNDDSFEKLYSPPKVLKKTEKHELELDSKKRIKKAASKTRKRRNIKNAFFKNEQVFSDIMAKHSVEDNFNPDDVQMALALSLSEKNNIVVTEGIRDSVTCSVNNLNNIKERLKMFGFKKVEKNDYDLALYLPTYGKKKTKWANRFTSLTLRETNKQVEKLKNNIQMFLDSQELEINTKFENTYNYETESPLLQRLQTGYEFMKNSKVVHEIKDLDEFYITELFTPGKNKVDSLLKKFENIPGRDFSPYGTSNEIHSKPGDFVYGSKPKNTEPTEQYHSEDIICPIDPLEQYTFLGTKDCNSSLHQRNKDECIINCSNKENNNIDTISTKLLKSPNDVTFNFSTPSPSKNCCETNYKASPDLFADSDPDTFDEKTELKPNNILLSEFGCDLTHFEKYSSSEDVKIQDSEDQRAEKDNNEAGQVDLNYSSKKSANEVEIAACFNLVNFNKSDSFSQSSNNSIECIILSDDEIEYSIMMSSKKPLNRKRDDEIEEKNFSFVELIQYEEVTSPKCSQNSSLVENYSTCSNMSPRFNLRKDNFFNKISSPNSDNLFSGYSRTSNTKLSDKPINSGKSKFENEISRPSIKCRKSLSHSFEKNSNKFENTKSEIMFNEKDINSMSIASKDYDDEDFDLSKLRTKFGITKTPKNIKDCGKLRKTLTDTSLPIKTNNSLKEYSSANKLSEFIDNALNDEFDKMINRSPVKSLEFEIKNSPKTFKDYGSLRKSLTGISIPQKHNQSLKKYSSANKFSEFIDVSDDEFDNMIYGSPAKSLGFYKPENFDVLLTGAINEIEVKQISPKQTVLNVFKESEKECLEFNFENRMYLITTTNIPKKPDYNFWNSTQLENELNKYGLKPLRKKQAVLMLDYIYHQMHPIIMEPTTLFSDFEDNNKVYESEVSNNSSNSNKLEKYHKFSLRDCSGQDLLDNDETNPELPTENYIFQTNRSKKIPTVLLPLHLAWYNLVKANPALNESILQYHPIDLQEIYLFLKQLGYRYDPKDIRLFFDERNIIFRYDLSTDITTKNRHIRKH